jgi:hypothetical protein
MACLLTFQIVPWNFYETGKVELSRFAVRSCTEFQEMQLSVRRRLRTQGWQSLR